MLKQVLEMYELMDDSRASGNAAAELLKSRGLTLVRVERIKGK